MTMPAWLAEAERLIGTREVPGAANNPIIMAWGNRLGARVLGIAYGADSVPWCGLFTAHCIVAAGLVPPRIAIRAKSWASWGVDAGMTATRPPLGAIAVFERAGGGHVGIVSGVSEYGRLEICGGNQGDAVNKRLFGRDRLIALRWPNGVAVARPASWTTAGIATTGEA